MKKPRLKVYISGPMTGLPRDEYRRRFAAAATWLQARGYCAVNPAMFAPCRHPWLYRLIGYRLTLWYDLQRLRRCDAIYIMPGWEQSRGSRVEIRCAERNAIPTLPHFIEWSLDRYMQTYINA